jgi:hypothetical protein
VCRCASRGLRSVGSSVLSSEGCDGIRSSARPPRPEGGGRMPVAPVGALDEGPALYAHVAVLTPTGSASSVMQREGLLTRSRERSGVS